MSWHIYNKNTELKTGDIIETSASKWFLVHFGVIFFIDGVQYISHCPLKEGRPQIEKLSEFKTKRIIYRYFRSDLTECLSDEFILNRSEELQVNEYDAATFNCEDYVKHIAEGVKLGIDLRLGIGISVLVTIIIIVVIIKLIKR